MCPNPGQVGVFEFRVGVGEEGGLLWGGGWGAFRVKTRGRGMNAKTAVGQQQLSGSRLRKANTASSDRKRLARHKRQS